MTPPKKRDWLKGVAQVGVFIRTKDGSVIEMATDRASEDTELLAFVLIAGPSQFPRETIATLRADYEAFVNRNRTAAKRATK